MPNIGFVHGRYPYGGGEKVTSNIAPYLSALGYKVFVFSSRIAHQQLTEEDKQYITFVDIGKTRLFSRPKVSLADQVNALGIDVLVFIGKSFSATREGIFQKTSCKCIFAHYGITFWQAENKQNELKAKASRDPFSFLWYQGVKIPLFHIGNQIKIAKYKLIYQRYHAFMVLCDAYKQELIEALQLKVNEKIVAIPIGIQPAPISYSMEKKKQLLYVGRMTHTDKRVERLVLVWQQLYQRFPDWEFLFLGEGEELPKLKQMAADLHLERIQFCGKQQTPPYYDQAAISCLSSQIEGFPLVLIEAQQAGVIPVAFACSAGVREILSPNGKCGVLVPSFDLTAYAEALAQLMSDASLRKQMQPQVLEKAAQYNIENIVKQWDALFKKIL